MVPIRNCRSEYLGFITNPLQVDLTGITPSICTPRQWIQRKSTEPIKRFIARHCYIEFRLKQASKSCGTKGLDMSYQLMNVFGKRRYEWRVNNAFLECKSQMKCRLSL